MEIDKDIKEAFEKLQNLQVVAEGTTDTLTNIFNKYKSQLSEEQLNDLEKDIKKYQSQNIDFSNILSKLKHGN